MPTFSFPAAAAAAATPAPQPSVSAETITKKTRDRKKKPAAAAAPAPEPEPPAEPAPAPAPEPVPEPEEPTPEPEEEESSYQPTFPDMVILKQTDHNYIVKHNHYPIAPLSQNSTPITDLVSPNQIHKGQINKKRGRKPKAGFIMNSNSGLYDTSEVPNIILHLKCHLSDLKTNESISNYEYTPAISEVESYTLTSSNYLQSSDIYQPNNRLNDRRRERDDDDDDDMDDVAAAAVAAADDSGRGGIDTTTTVIDTAATDRVKHKSSITNDNTVTKKLAVSDAAINVLNERTQKEIMKKINRLKYSFHNGETIQTKINDKSACFWDTCEFEGPIYYIPIMIVNGVFQVNGCYCSPECAVAALLKEPLDTSTKFERLHLLHLLYGTPSGKGFKPAPNPNYLLDKYYGNLTIQEYRALLKGPQMIHIVNKPLTHILPELYEDNNDFLVNSKVIPTNSLKMKKRYKTMVVQGAE
jgi:hypothetical protein